MSARLPLGTRVEDSHGTDIGTVVDYESDRCQVRWDADGREVWYPLGLVRVSEFGEDEPGVFATGPAAPIETIPTEVVCVPSDATIADLARAHTASIMEWNRAHATTEPSHEDAMAIFERRDRTLFALLDALHPGWRDVYEAAWGVAGRTRRADARDGVEGQVSP